MKDGKLEPGEIRVTSQCLTHGVQQYERVRDDGVHEQGVLVPAKDLAEAEAYSRRTGREFRGVLEFGEDCGNGVKRVAADYRFNSRGSTGAASNAYRSGWDGVFGSRQKSVGPN